ncbi:hypothetical protein VPH35_000924 [Triticum aestivum]
MLEALQGASINEEHHAIMSAVVQKVQSAKNILTEACTSLLTGFEATLLASAALTAEVDTLKQDLERSEQQLERAKKKLEDNEGAFADLPRSVSDASAFYRAEEGSSTEKVFWSQYAEAGHPVPLSDQLKQLVEPNKVAEQAMKGLVVRLWLGEAQPGSYFGLVRRLVEACPRLEVIKRSVCIERARRAFARAKVHWGRLDAEKLVKDGPPPGKEHSKPKNYYKDVLKGARLVADECTKDVFFE